MILLNLVQAFAVRRVQGNIGGRILCKLVNGVMILLQKRRKASDEAHSQK